MINDPYVKVGIFDLAIYGTPNALMGILYCHCLVASKWLLPEGRSNQSSPVATEDILLTPDMDMGAKLMPWSPAAGRAVKTSGLGNTGGTYLLLVLVSIVSPSDMFIVHRSSCCRPGLCFECW
jgi:hypothetical protein